MKEEIKEIIVKRDDIQKKVKELGRRISRDYEGKELILVGVLKGAFVFLADLMREISITIDLDFISVSSYGKSKESSGFVRILKDIEIDIKGKNLLIVEDLVDTGLTLNYLLELFRKRGAKSVKICAAFDKPSRRKADIEVEYAGIIIPDVFIVGYGLDYAGKYRNLPDVCWLYTVE